MKKLIVLAASLAMVASFAMTAAAADWSFYGSSRVNTWWTSVETINPPVSTPDVDNFGQALQGNARIGASVKVSDELTGGFEYGTGVNVRKLYGEWNFGAGSFLVGQTYTPLNLFYSNQVFGSDNDLLNVGGVYSGRHPMLRLKFGNFQIATVPSSTASNIAPAIAAIPAVPGVSAAIPGSTNTVENDIPAIEAAYTFSLSNFSAKLAAGYSTFEETVGTTTFDVNSYVVALGAKANFGMAYVGGNIYTGENVSNLIALNTQGDGAWATAGSLASATGTQLNDSEALGYILVVGAKLNDMFSFELGYGHAETELDATGSVEDEVESYYAQSTITFAPGVFVVPEIGMIDGEETGDSETTYFGAKWQINF